MRRANPLFAGGGAGGLMRRAVVLLVVAWLLAARGVAADTLTEYRIKSAYLFNFTKFVEWPPRSFGAADAPLTIGVLDDDGATARIVADVLAGKTAPRGRRIVVRAFTALRADVLECHMLFVTRSAGLSAGAVRAALGTRPVLLVGETEEFAERGGTIAFVLSGDAIRFEINPRRAQSAGLRVSGALASVARLVRDREDD